MPRQQERTGPQHTPGPSWAGAAQTRSAELPQREGSQDPGADGGRGSDSPSTHLVPSRRVLSPTNTERISFPKEAAFTGSSLHSWQCRRYWL